MRLARTLPPPTADGENATPSELEPLSSRPALLLNAVSPSSIISSSLNALFRRNLRPIRSLDWSSVAPRRFNMLSTSAADSRTWSWKRTCRSCASALSSTASTSVSAESLSFESTCSTLDDTDGLRLGFSILSISDSASRTFSLSVAVVVLLLSLSSSSRRDLVEGVPGICNSVGCVGSSEVVMVSWGRLSGQETEWINEGRVMLALLLLPVPSPLPPPPPPRPLVDAISGINRPLFAMLDSVLLPWMRTGKQGKTSVSDENGSFTSIPGFLQLESPKWSSAFAVGRSQTLVILIWYWLENRTGDFFPHDWTVAHAPPTSVTLFQWLGYLSCLWDVVEAIKEGQASLLAVANEFAASANVCINPAMQPCAPQIGQNWLYSASHPTGTSRIAIFFCLSDYVVIAAVFWFLDFLITNKRLRGAKAGVRHDKSNSSFWSGVVAFCSCSCCCQDEEQSYSSSCHCKNPEL